MLSVTRAVGSGWGAVTLTASPTQAHLMAFYFDQPYDAADDLPPADIREDFSGLTFEHGCDPQQMLDRLACWLPADKLREFMDDLAMGRI